MEGVKFDLAGRRAPLAFVRLFCSEFADFLCTIGVKYSEYRERIGQRDFLNVASECSSLCVCDTA